MHEAGGNMRVAHINMRVAHAYLFIAHVNMRVAQAYLHKAINMRKTKIREVAESDKGIGVTSLQDKNFGGRNARL